LAGGIINQGSGVIDLWGNSSLLGTSYGYEYLINQGIINMMTGSSSSIDFNNLTNQAKLAAQHGTLQIHSTHLNFQSSETLGVGIYSQADYGQLNLVNVVPLTGVLQVSLNGGFTPVPGDSFAVVTYPSLSGSFSSLNLPHPLPLAVWDPVYGATALTLLVQPPVATLSSGTNVVINVNGTNGQQAILLTSTNLTMPLVNWTPLTTNTIGITGLLSVTNNIIPGVPKQFFIFRLQ
jgi:hypothetical protein